MIKPYIKNETAVDIICSICDRMYPGMDCEPADCEWMKMLAEEAVDAVPVVHGRWMPFHSEAAGDIQYCSACEIGFDARTDYCPHCGDAVPVVRCKDCKYRDGTPGQPNILCAQMHEDDFCSYGERKEESHDRLQKDL